MAAPVCDICGGKLMMGAGGVAVCKECGTEYSMERFRELMKECKDAPAADTPAAEAPAADKSKVENLLLLAKAAEKTGNYEEAETYSNRVLEQDASNAEAWIIKGTAVDWQSSLGEPRLEETLSCYAKGVACASEEERNDAAELCLAKMVLLMGSMLDLRADSFIKNPVELHCSGMFDQTREYPVMLGRLSDEIKSTDADYDLRREQLNQLRVNAVSRAATEAYTKTVAPEFRQYERPDNKDGENRRFITQVDLCKKLLHMGIVYSTDDDHTALMYKNLVFLNNQAIDSIFWVCKNGQWVSYPFLTDESIALRREDNKKFEQKAEEFAQKAKNARVEAYWAEHGEEKAELEARLAPLEQQEKELNKKLEDIPEKAARSEAEKKANQIAQEKASLGLFKMKEKKAMQEQLDAAWAEYDRLDQLVSRKAKEIRKEMEPVQKQAAQLREELTRDRKE